MSYVKFSNFSFGMCMKYVDTNSFIHITTRTVRIRQKDQRHSLIHTVHAGKSVLRMILVFLTIELISSMAMAEAGEELTGAQEFKMVEVGAGHSAQSFFTYQYHSFSKNFGGIW